MRQELDRQVGTIAHRRVATCPPMTTLRGAALVLADEMVGALLVGRVDEPLGIVSERDLVRAMSDSADVYDDRVRNWMSDDIEVVRATATVREAATLMLTDEIRHLVVVDDDGNVVGMVSIRDVLAAAVAETAPA
jgi:CBS domain-containing protein